MDETEKQKRREMLDEMMLLTSQDFKCPISAFRGLIDEDLLKRMASLHHLEKCQRKEIKYYLKKFRRRGKWCDAVLEIFDPAIFERWRQSAIAYSESNIQLHDLAERAREISRYLRTNSQLTYLKYLVPRRHREAFIGDILEDVADMRRDGMKEQPIRRFIYWQLALVVKERLKRLAGAGIGIWLVEKARRLLGS